MRPFFLAFVMSLLLLISASNTRGGQSGRVVGRVDSLIVRKGYRGVVALVNEDVRVDTRIEEDGTFIFQNVTPGRYLLAIGEGALLTNEFEVVPDLTTLLMLDSPKVKESGFRSLPNQEYNGYAYRGLNLGYFPMVYPDKTFSGGTCLSEEELRARREPLTPMKVIKWWKANPQ